MNENIHEYNRNNAHIDWLKQKINSHFFIKIIAKIYLLAEDEWIKISKFQKLV
jgi:hypothetical protein